MHEIVIASFILAVVRLGLELLMGRKENEKVR